MIGGASFERSADDVARRLTPGLNARDVLLLAALMFDREGSATPNELIGPVHTTAAGVSGSLRRLSDAGLIFRSVGTDARTRPVELSDTGRQLILEVVEPWQDWFEGALHRLSDTERNDLYRLLMKGSGLWDGVWPDEPGSASADEVTTSSAASKTTTPRARRR